MCAYSRWNIHIISLNFCAMHVCSRGWDDTLASEQLDSAGFSVFTNSMNNYPGVAANSEETRQTLPGYRPQPTRRKTCWTPHQIPCSLFCCSFSLSFALVTFHLSFPSVSFSLCAVWITRFVFLCVWSFRATSSSFLSIYFSFCASLFLDRRNTQAENKLYYKWKWLNKIGNFRIFLPMSQIMIICQLRENKHCHCGLSHTGGVTNYWEHGFCVTFHFRDLGDIFLPGDVC